jgi:glycerol-3-phosphate dehydrogenase
MVGLGPRVALDVDEAAAQVAVRHLGWSRERAEREVKEYRDFVRRYKPKTLSEIESLKA